MKLVVTLLVATAALAAPPFTIDQVLSAPFSDNLTAGPGSRVAWVINTRGVRNVWVAEMPDYRGRQLTSFREDDGMEIGQLRWLADGRRLLFVRGGDLEHPGSANPNPNSRPEPVEQAIWLASLSDGSLQRISDGHSPAVAGERVVFIKSGQVWSAELGGGAKPAILISAKGSAAGLTVSPDGQWLAVLSNRGDHSLIGVYNFAAKSYRYLDPSLDRDLDPVWSPDSKSVAFIRAPAWTRVRFGPVRAARQPWTIRIAEAAGGRSRQLFEALPGAGSAFALDSGGTPLLWADGRLVFPWERDGWLHLYSISADGGAPALLTPGNFEVEYMALAADGKSVVYSSNQDDADRRHLWRVDVRAGSAPARITSGQGIEWSPAPLASGAIAMLRSDERQSATAAIQSTASLQDIAPNRDAPPSLVAPQPVILSATDGMRIHGQLFLPPGGSSGRHPALVFFHGGSRRQMLLGRHGMYYYSNTYAMNQYLAAQGYVVLAVNYRSGIGYGLDFREALNYGAAGASEFNDVMGAGLYLRGRPDVDPNRIGLWGGSYGGYLTALGLARASDLYKAGVDLHGVHDWSKLGRGVESDPEMIRTAFQSSPMASLNTWRSPVLLIHGDDDRNVPFSQSVVLIEALRERQVHVEQLVFPDEVHDFLTHAHWLAAYTALADFFARML